MDAEHDQPTMAEMMLWKSRAKQNKAEARAAELERDHWKRLARQWEKRAKGNRARLAQATENNDGEKL